MSAKPRLVTGALAAAAVVMVAVIPLAGCSEGSGRSGASSSTSITASTAHKKVTRSSNLAAISARDLPDEAVRVLALIDSGGSFPYRQDGATFQNREGLLPRRSGGYYHEYTVETPGSPDRGARRIIVGGGERYYTADHYASFREIVDR